MWVSYQSGSWSLSLSRQSSQPLSDGTTVLELSFAVRDSVSQSVGGDALMPMGLVARVCAMINLPRTEPGPRAVESQ